jgi:hypothetical protein
MESSLDTDPEDSLPEEYPPPRREVLLACEDAPDVDVDNYVRFMFAR